MQRLKMHTNYKKGLLGVGQAYENPKKLEHTK